MAYVVIIILILAFIFAMHELNKSARLLERNREVAKLRMEILDLIYSSYEEDCERYQLALAAFSGIEYEDMFNSDIPLTMENWYTEEQIKLFKNEE